MADRRQSAASWVWPAWLAMGLRSASALLGGYAATSAIVSLLARVAPVTRVEATAWGMIASFPVLASLGLWAFHEPKLSRVAAVLWGSFVIAAAAVLALGPRP